MNILRTVLQRVLSAEVAVDEKTVGSINKGYVLFVGIGKEDNFQTVENTASKISRLRLFEDENGKINLSLSDVGGELLVISNFTLYADCKKRRPSFSNACPPAEAKALYDHFCGFLTGLDGICRVEKGIFGADMRVTVVNDGPVNIILED